MADDRVLLITGAATGIGAATARRPPTPATSVVLAPARPDKLEALAAELGGDDARSPSARRHRLGPQEALVAAALERFGRLDVAFANAGFGAARGWLEETPEHWRDMVLTNVLGAAYTLRARIPALKETKGHLLITGSVAGRRAMPGSLYSCDEVGGHRDGRGGPRRPQRHRRPRRR